MERRAVLQLDPKGQPPVIASAASAGSMAQERQEGAVGMQKQIRAVPRGAAVVGGPSKLSLHGAAEAASQTGKTDGGEDKKAAAVSSNGEEGAELRRTLDFFDSEARIITVQHRLPCPGQQSTNPMPFT
jgi:hypothetical protein